MYSPMYISSKPIHNKNKFKHRTSHSGGFNNTFQDSGHEKGYYARKKRVNNYMGKGKMGSRYSVTPPPVMNNGYMNFQQPNSSRMNTKTRNVSLPPTLRSQSSNNLDYFALFSNKPTQGHRNSLSSIGSNSPNDLFTKFNSYQIPSEIDEFGTYVSSEDETTHMRDFPFQYTKKIRDINLESSKPVNHNQRNNTSGGKKHFGKGYRHNHNHNHGHSGYNGHKQYNKRYSKSSNDLRKEEEKETNFKESNNSYGHSHSHSHSRTHSHGKDPQQTRENYREREKLPDSIDWKSFEFQKFSDKQKFKIINKQTKNLKTYEHVEKFLVKILKSKALKHTWSWKLYLLLAENARKENKSVEAKKWYKKALGSDHGKREGLIWSDFAKLEEECGNFKECENLLLQGLENCKTSDILYIKLLKFYEEKNDIDRCRAVLGRLRYVVPNSLNRVWKVVLEGGILESRYNMNMGRKVFQWLMNRVNQGLVYYEAFKLEEKCGRINQAIRIVEEGLKRVPKFAALWFSALRLYEKLGMIKKVRFTVNEAVQHITKEICWKVYCEAAYIEDRLGYTQEGKNMLMAALKMTNYDSRWKVFLIGSRIAIKNKQFRLGRILIQEAVDIVPEKNRVYVYLEFAKIEEFSGNISKARQIYKKCQIDNKHEWKVFLESILLELRSDNIKEAIKQAKQALAMHPAVGRLWSIFIRLHHNHTQKDIMYPLFVNALQVVPKSGEVWVEYARKFLNPLSVLFDIKKAKKYIQFAVKFTPQYGDSFIEYLRIELLEAASYANDLSIVQNLITNSEPNYGQLWFFCRKNQTDSILDIFTTARTKILKEITHYKDIYQTALLIMDYPIERKKKILEPFKKKYSNSEFLSALSRIRYKKKYLYQSIYVSDPLKKWL